MKNEFIGLKELGIVACVNRDLRQYICVDIDDDIWSILLHKKWPSTSKIQQQIIRDLSYRSWYERLEKAVLPGVVYMNAEDGELDDDELEENETIRKTLFSRRDNLIGKLMSMSDTKDEFPPLAAPRYVVSGGYLFS